MRPPSFSENSVRGTVLPGKAWSRPQLCLIKSFIPTVHHLLWLAARLSCFPRPLVPLPSPPPPFPPGSSPFRSGGSHPNDPVPGVENPFLPDQLRMSSFGQDKVLLQVLGLCYLHDCELLRNSKRFQKHARLKENTTKIKQAQAQRGWLPRSPGRWDASLPKRLSIRLLSLPQRHGVSVSSET